MSSMYSLFPAHFAGTNGGTTPSSGGGPAVEANETDCPHQITNLLPCDQNGDGSVWNTLAIIVNFLAIGVGVAVLVGIIFGAFLYASSAGNAEQAKKGINYIRNAIIALLLFVFMYALINFVVPGGVL